MDLVLLSPFRTASFVWRRGRGGFGRTVVCKATYELLPGRARLAREQEPLHDADEHWDDDPARSVYAPSDLVPWKARADVVLVGRAFAPKDEPVSAVRARLVVGTVDKTLEVHCDRAWSGAGRIVGGRGFRSMPLAYERAAGGPGTWNPVGVRADARPGPDGLVMLPNLLPPGFEPTSPGARIPPVGFGPIAPGWPDRLAKLGSHAPLARGPVQEVPDDLGPACFNAAPPDQQPDALRADEPIVLENLDARHAVLSTALPGVRPRVLIDAPSAPKELAMTADTLWIDTDRRICTLTWRGTFFLEDAEAKGRIFVAAEEPGQTHTPADIEALAKLADVEATQIEALDDTEVTLRPSRERKPALPFQPAVGSWSPASPASPPASIPLPPAPPVVSFGRVPAEGGAAPAAPVAAALAAPAPRASRIGPWSPPTSATALRAPVTTGSPVGASSTTGSPVGAAFTTGSPVGAAFTTGSPVGAPSTTGPRAGPEPGDVPHASRDAAGAPLMSALALSNAAAGAGASAAGPAPAAPQAAVAPEVPRSRPTEVLEVLWCDPALMPRVRAKPAWKKLITGAAPSADEEGGARDRAKEARDLREALLVLRYGEALDAAGIEAALDTATEGGTFAPPLVLAAGELAFPFDERETLQATLALAAPFAGSDRKLKELCDAARGLLESPWLDKGSAGLDGLIAPLRDAFAKSARGVAPGSLEAQTERLLLEQRRHQKRTFLGEEWIRALFTPAGAEHALPLYLPLPAAKQLPLFVRFRARVLAELRLPLDQHEAAESALRAVALARLVSRPRRA